jgi:hypothetical protein
MKIRALRDGDRELVAGWIEGDSHHAGSVKAEFFTQEQPGLTQFVVVDERGDPVLFVALEKIVRGHIQFNPGARAAANVKGLRWLAGLLKTGLAKLGVREFVTDSRSAPLISFLERYLGMRKLVADYSATIAPDLAVGNRDIEPSGHRVIEEQERMGKAEA